MTSAPNPYASGQSLLLNANPFAPRGMAVVDRVGIDAGQVHAYCIRASGGPLAVTLVWTDYPASPAAAKALVR